MGKPWLAAAGRPAPPDPTVAPPALILPAPLAANSSRLTVAFTPRPTTRRHPSPVPVCSDRDSLTFTAPTT